MPELPEVEAAARNLRRWAVGRRIEAVRPSTAAARIFRPANGRALSALAGARIREVRRHGKNLLVTLDAPAGPLGLWSHLGMTGKWLRRSTGEPAPRFSRLELELDDGTRLHYADLRLFGRVRLVPGARFDELPDIRALGPDPLEDGVDAAALHAGLARSKLPIKVALLDQRLLPGVGNIQASEALHRAGIDPRRPARSLSLAEVKALGRGVLASIRFTLDQMTPEGADADADIEYVEDPGTPNPFRVYGREGEPCPRCGKGKTKGKQPGKGRGSGPGTIVRIVQAGRATFYCPRCQR